MAAELTTAADRFHAVLTQIKQASARYREDKSEPRLLAVSKTKPASAIVELAELGQRDFGENYLQEAVEKRQQLQRDYADFDQLVWHFIGHVQSNKTQIIAEHFDSVQTVDRFKIARRLDEQRPAGLAPINICIQVNISNEASKSGIMPLQLWDLVDEVLTLKNVRLRGLMAIPAPDNSPEQLKLKADFSAMQELYQQLQQRVEGIDTLSIGMSSDLALAVEYGSTMVRVGTALFGAREYK